MRGQSKEDHHSSLEHNPERTVLVVSLNQGMISVANPKKQLIERRRRLFIYLNRHAPSGQSRVYRVTQLRTDDVDCRESAGTGPLNLKVVPVTSAALAGHHGPINVRPSFPTPTIIYSMKWLY